MKKNQKKDVRSTMPNPPGMSPLNSPVSQTEGDLFKQLSLNAMKIIYKDDSVTDKLINQLNKHSKQDLAKALALVSKIVIDEAKKYTKPERMQGPIMPEMVTRAANGIVAEVAKLGNISGAGQFDQTVKEEALQLVLGSVLKDDARTGKLDPNALMNFTKGHATRANEMMAKGGKV